MMLTEFDTSYRSAIKKHYSTHASDNGTRCNAPIAR